MSCLHELAKSLEHSPENHHNHHTKTIDISHTLISTTNSTTAGTTTTTTAKDLEAIQLHKRFYELPPIDPILQEKKPWKQDVNYFRKTYISSLALMKMCMHAQLGGSIEIMGMLIGKIIPSCIIVMDVYRLPVEGTETRVNAQNEAYEYMVTYLQNNQNLGKRDENIVGWYHSHPGYGCWLSGIDVSTQSLNQGFQDPYLAIVIDPIRTLKSGKVDIGAFRTYPDNYRPNREGNNNNTNNNNNSVSGSGKGGSSNKVGNLPKSKRKDFGSYSDRYYSLDVEIFTSELDDKVIDLLKDEDSLSWMRSLLTNGNEIMGIKEKDIKSIELIRNYELSQDNNDDDNIFTLIEQLKKLNQAKLPGNKLNNRKIDSNFEQVLYKKLLRKSKRSMRTNKEVEVNDDEIFDESDLEKNAEMKAGGAGTVSDADDVLSKDGDDDEEDDDDEASDEDEGDHTAEEEEDEEMIDEEHEEDRLLQEVGDLAVYNLSDAFDDPRRRMEVYTRRRDQQQQQQQQRHMLREGELYRMGEHPGSELIKPSTSDIHRRGRRRRGGGGDGSRRSGGNVGDRDQDQGLDHSSLDGRLGSGGSVKDNRNKNQSMVKLAKSIGLHEVFDLITLETQQKLFT